MHVTKFTAHTGPGELIGTVEYSDGKTYKAWSQYGGSVRFQTVATSKNGHTSNKLFKSEKRLEALNKHRAA